MQRTEVKLLYHAFGLNISSQVYLPELIALSDDMSRIDVEVKIGALQEKWDKLFLESDKFIIQKDLIMFRVSNVATFCVTGGNNITISPLNDANYDQIRLYILGTCMGAILLQRGILPLHGSAVAIKGKAYAIIGESGAGKSTLASSFMIKGYQLLSDDVIAVSLSKKNNPIVTPSFPQQKLWQQSLTELGMKANDYRPLFLRETKYAVPVNDQYYKNPLPLAGIIELEKNKGVNINLESNSKLEGLDTLLRHTYRNFLIPNSGLIEWHFNISAQVRNKVEIFKLYRPDIGFNPNQLVSLILNTFNLED